MIKQLLLLTILVPSIACFVEGAVHVSGHLVCNGKPYANERVQIFEKNYLFADGKWAETLTDENGNFDMKGRGHDWFSVTPYVYIPNYCGTSVVDGRRCTTGAIQINVPIIKISETHIPDNEFDVGTVELNSNKKSDPLGLGSVFAVFRADKECRSYK